jgi:hypothetical protein
MVSRAVIGFMAALTEYGVPEADTNGGPQT